ncbi:restriction endonuclease subunit S [Shewanella sp.]|uniref:restriction endonuclease subunit S n=1 Tax=Shewanella sp. TaxID=50422 RepID=UPI00404881DF
MAFNLTTLSEYAKVQGGFAYKSKDFIEYSENRVLKIKNVRFGTVSYEEPAYISDEIAQSTEAWATKEGDILISMTGSGPNAPQSLVGRVARVWANEPQSYINQRVGRIQLLEEGKVHPDFLFYLLSLPQSQDFLVSNSSGSANQANISGKIIGLLPCPEVTYEESESIANMVRSLDEKIILNRQTNQTLEQMAQALFKSWFVDFDPVIDNVLAAGSDIPEALQHKAEQRAIYKEKSQQLQPAPETKSKPLPDNIRELFPNEFEQTGQPSIGIAGWIPKGWKNTSFESLIKLIGGGTPKTSIDEYWNGDIPWFSVVDAPNDSDVFVLDTEKHVTQLGVDKSSTKILRTGTTIISARGTVGKCALVGEPMAMNQSCYGINGNEGIADTFIYFLTRYQVSDLQKRGHGSVFNTITRETFKSINLAFSGGKLTQTFEQLVKPYLDKILLNNRQITELAKTRDVLLPKLISGELQLQE